MPNKIIHKRLKLDPSFSRTIETDYHVWSHDNNSYEMKFEFFDETDKQPIDLTGAKMRVLLHRASVGTQIYELNVEDAEKGLANFIIPQGVLGYQGKFHAHLYADFDNKTHDFGNFTFYSHISKIDDDFDGDLNTIYVSEFEKALEEIQEILRKFDGVEMDIDEKIKQIEQAIEQHELEVEQKLNDINTSVDDRFDEINTNVDESEQSLSNRYEQLKNDMDDHFKQIDESITQTEQASLERFDKLENDVNEKLETTTTNIDETEANVLTKLDELDKKIDDKDVAKQYDLQVKNNQLTHGVDYIEPPLQGYRQEEIWKPDNLPVYINGMNLVVNPQEETTYRTETPEIGQYLIKEKAYLLDNVDAREQPLITVVRARGKGDVIINLAVNQGVGQFKLSDDYKWYCSNDITVSRANYSYINIYGRGVTELEISDLYIIWNPSKPYEQYISDNNPSINSILNITGMAIAKENSDKYNSGDFESYDGELYKPNFLDMQAQIDELKNAVLNQGGTM